MRKICIIIFVVLGLVFYLANSKAAEKIDIRLENQLGIVFLNQNMLLVVSEDEMTLLVIAKSEPDNLDKFYLHNLSIVMLGDNLTDIEGDKSIVLQNDYKIGNVTYSKRNGLIYVNYKNTNMCIYMGGEYNISSCQFVYFYNPNVSRLTLYDRNEYVFYYYKEPLADEILEDLYEELVDTKAIRDDELTIIKLNDEDYDIVVIDNE